MERVSFNTWLWIVANIGAKIESAYHDGIMSIYRNGRLAGVAYSPCGMLAEYYIV
jgi:hypothetical protein